MLLSKVLLTNGLLVTFTDRDTRDPAYTPLARRVDVLIEGDRIANISQANTIAPHGAEVIDCTEKWIAPGFVDTHRHMWMSVIHGQEDWTLAEFFGKLTYTTTQYVTPEDVYIGELAGSLQALHGGVTTVVDHFHCANSAEHIEKAVQAVTESGLRTMLCIARQSLATNIHPLEFKNDKEIAQMQISALETLARKGGGKLTPDGRATLGLALDTFGNDPIEGARILDLARSLNVTPITAHHSRGPQAPAPGGVPRAWYEAGQLKDDVLFTHCSEFSHPDSDEEEWEFIKETGASISVTPGDELGMGIGDPVAYEALRRDIKVGLGIDAKSIVSADMFPAMHQMLQWERGRLHYKYGHESPPKALKYNPTSSASVFRLATLGGAEAAHVEHKVGSIEEGKLADIVLYSADSINLIGREANPFAGIAIHATAEDVDTVIVNGRFVKRNGTLLPITTAQGQWGWKDVARVLQERIHAIDEKLKDIDMEKRYTLVAKAMQIAFV